MWVTFVLFPIFLGLLIFGFASGNNTTGIIGIVFLVIDVIVGITMTYLRNKSANREAEKVANSIYREMLEDATEHAQELARKLKRIQTNRGAQERFTDGELVSACVNLVVAKDI